MVVPATTQRKDLFTIYRIQCKKNVEVILSATFAKLYIFFKISTQYLLLQVSLKNSRGLQGEGYIKRGRCDFYPTG
jgi:hypothetical protein